MTATLAKYNLRSFFKVYILSLRGLKIQNEKLRMSR
jgi:hypothetical protein